MTFNAHSLELMIKEIEGLLKRDNRFGGLHQIENTQNGELRLTWDNNVLRQKSKANPGPYLAFMEELSDCLEDFGYCLLADDEANENSRNNYLLIVPDNDDLASED